MSYTRFAWRYGLFRDYLEFLPRATFCIYPRVVRTTCCRLLSLSRDLCSPNFARCSPLERRDSKVILFIHCMQRVLWFAFTAAYTVFCSIPRKSAGLILIVRPSSAYSCLVSSPSSSFSLQSLLPPPLLAGSPSVSVVGFGFVGSCLRLHPDCGAAWPGVAWSCLAATLLGFKGRGNVRVFLFHGALVPLSISHLLFSVFPLFPYPLVSLQPHSSLSAGFPLNKENHSTSCFHPSSSSQIVFC